MEAVTVTCQINQLMKFCDGKWKDYNGTARSKIYLKVSRDQFVIISNGKVLETFSAYGSKKGFFKGTVFILVIKESDGLLRKIRFSFISTDELKMGLDALGRFFPLTDWNKPDSQSGLDKYKTIQEVLKDALNSKQMASDIAIFPQIEEFTKLCLLDPMFPQLICETDQALKGLNLI